MCEKEHDGPASAAVSRATYEPCSGSDDDGGKEREVDAAWGKD